MRENWPFYRAKGNREDYPWRGFHRRSRDRFALGHLCFLNGLTVVEGIKYHAFKIWTTSLWLRINPPLYSAGADQENAGG